MTNLGQNLSKKQENHMDFYVILRENSVDVLRPLKLRQRRDEYSGNTYLSLNTIAFLLSFSWAWCLPKRKNGVHKV